VPLLVGAVLAVALGVFGRLHHPTGRVPWMWPFTDVYVMKVWLTLVVLILAAAQFVLVEPDFQPGRRQAVAQQPRRRPVGGGIADEDRRQRRGC